MVPWDVCRKSCRKGGGERVARRKGTPVLPSTRRWQRPHAAGQRSGPGGLGICSSYRYNEVWGYIVLPLTGEWQGLLVPNGVPCGCFVLGPTCAASGIAPPLGGMFAGRGTASGGARLLGAEDLADAEVADLDDLVLRDQEVVRLDVAPRGPLPPPGGCVCPPPTGPVGGAGPRARWMTLWAWR